MSRKILLILLFYIVSSINTMAQTDCYFYYNGQKTPLILNESKVCISIPKDLDKTSQRIRANVEVLNTINDETFDIVVITRSDFEKLTSLDFWEEDAKSVILTSSYYTENNKEIFISPYLNVRLKKEEDINLLTYYAEKYKLRIVMNLPLMPLWYILAITQDSEKDPLECANELYETGDFAQSIPDFVSNNSIDTNIRNIVFATIEKNSNLYDLQGHKLTSKPVNGFYIIKRKIVLARSQ